MLILCSRKIHLPVLFHKVRLPYPNPKAAREETKTYVVFVGRKPGIYDKWYDAHVQVYRFPGACYKRYDSREEALEAFNQLPVQEDQVSDGTSSSSTSTATSGGVVNQSQKLATCLKAQSELASEIRNLCSKMEMLCEEIKREFGSEQ